MKSQLNIIIFQKFHYKFYNKNRIESDPIKFPHKLSSYKDIEIMAFIASIFAYGKMEQIISSLEQFLKISENQPYDFVLEYNKKFKVKFYHRFYNCSGIQNLLLTLKLILKKHKSIKNFFLIGYSQRHENLKQAISEFSIKILKLFEENSIKLNHAIKFMFPIPSKGSACKRMNLFLRWMVRKDNVDFGLWNEIPKNKLIIPVDTHIARISRKLKLTERKQVSWNMAEEITAGLKKFDPDDPIKYDFSLCHLGISKNSF